MKINYNSNEIRSSLLTYINDDSELKKTLKTNLNIVGKLRAIIEAASRGISEYLFNIILSVYNNIFIDSSDDEALIQHLADRGMEPWKQAMKSTGKVRVGSSTVPTGTFPIPQLTVVGTDGSNSDEIKQFILLSGGSVDGSTPVDSKGYYTIEIDIESVEAGSEYNVPVDSITQFISEVPGYNIVYNPEDTSNGRDIETTDEVKSRIKVRDVATQQGSRAWFESQTLEFVFVSEVVVVPRYAGKGTVGIAFLTPSGIPTLEQKNEVADYFNSEDIDPAGAYNVIIFDMAEFIWDATIRVYWQDIEPSDSDLNAALANYFSLLKRGEDIIEDQIIAGIIYNVGGIKAVDIISHSGFTVDIYEYPIMGTITWDKVEYAE